MTKNLQKLNNADFESFLQNMHAFTFIFGQPEIRLAQIFSSEHHQYR